MFMTEYVNDPAWAPQGFLSIGVLNRNIIDEFYRLEASLLVTQFGSS